MFRVVGRLEREWADAAQRSRLRDEAVGRTNPQIELDEDDPSMSLWTWVVEDAGARSVLLWTNPVFDHADVSRAELTRLDDSDLWTICLRLPSALRASYRIGSWYEDGIAPWRAEAGRRPVLLAAMAATREDPRCEDAIVGSRGVRSSVAAGPAAPADLVRALPNVPSETARLTRLELSNGEAAWVRSPRDGSAPTPLLVLFDGGVWRHMLPGMLDRAEAAGILPPIHVAMLDEGDGDHRWQHLGVPAGQVDVVIDELLPRVREGWNVSSSGAETIVCGQSLGGIAALWTLALSAGDVRHAIAQSPSLWRFDVSEALLDAPAWDSVDLQAGTFEGDMLPDAAALATALRADPRSSGRTVSLSPFEAGHDWAAWRTNLIGSLAALLPRSQV
jgi:enterochelin esterase family protein